MTEESQPRDVMTTNQQRAIQLAELLANGHVSLSELSDESWHLLVLASGLTHRKVPARVVVERVIENYLHGEDYFCDVEDAAAAVTDDSYRVELPPTAG